MISIQELISFGVASFALGYTSSFVFYIFRRFLSSAT